MGLGKMIKGHVADYKATQLPYKSGKTGKTLWIADNAKGKRAEKGK